MFSIFQIILLLGNNLIVATQQTINFMGAANSSSGALTWKLHSKTSNFDILHCQEKTLVAQRHLIPIQSKSINRTLQLYELRKSPNMSIVQVYHAEKKPNTYICKGMDLLQVIVERIPNRLSVINSLSISDAVSIFMDCLKGYKIICNFSGGFNVKADMIGIDSNNRAKVWINQNFAANFVQGNGLQKFEKKISQQHMSQQIFELIATRLKQQHQSQFRRIFSQHLETFEQAINCSCGFLYSKRTQSPSFKTMKLGSLQKSGQKCQLKTISQFQQNQIALNLRNIRYKNQKVSSPRQYHPSKSPQSRSNFKQSSKNIIKFSDQKLLPDRRVKSPQATKQTTISGQKGIIKNFYNIVPAPQMIHRVRSLQSLNKQEPIRNNHLIRQKNAIPLDLRIQNHEKKYFLDSPKNSPNKIHHIRTISSGYSPKYQSLNTNPHPNFQLCSTPLLSQRSNCDNDEKLSIHSQRQMTDSKTERHYEIQKEQTTQCFQKPTGLLYVDRDKSLARMCSSNKLSQKDSQVTLPLTQSHSSKKQQNIVTQEVDIKPSKGASKSSQIRNLMRIHNQQNIQLTQKLRAYNKRVLNPEKHIVDHFNQIVETDEEEDSIVHNLHRILDVSEGQGSNQQQEAQEQMERIPVITYEELKSTLLHLNSKGQSLKSIKLYK